MKSIMRATAVLGSASVVSVLTGLASAKASALLVGPSGIGYIALLQSLLGFTGIVAALGVGTGLVRLGAQAVTEEDTQRIAALRRAAWLLWGVVGGAAALLMILGRELISRFIFGGPQLADAVALTAVGLLFTLAAGVQTGILNAHHRVGALARSTMLTSVLALCSTLIILWRWRAAGIPWAVLAGCIISWAASAYYLQRMAPAAGVGGSWRKVFAAARELLRFGGPYMMSLLVGQGVVLALPVLVLHALDADSVGFYRAAAIISLTYLGFVTASMAQDYYPRVSAVADQKEALCRLINEQHWLMLLLGGPLILGMMALVPYIVPVIYSPEFGPTVALLEWQLIGDIFKLAAWTVAFVVLVRSGSLTFFLLELVGGASMLLFSWIGIRWLALEGLGVGFVLCTAIYYLLSWAILRRTIGLRWTARNVRLFWSLILLAALIRALPYVGAGDTRTPVALVLAMLVSAYSFRVLSAEVGGLRPLLARLKRGRGVPAPREEQAGG